MDAESLAPSEQTNIPPHDELLFHWTLSATDLEFVAKRSQNPHFRVWLGLQMCFLSLNGGFARQESDFPPAAISWMNRQFSLHPLSPLQNPTRDATWSQQRFAVLDHLAWIEFSRDDVRVKEFVKNQVLLGKAKSEILERAPAILKENKIVIPAQGELEKYIRSEIEAASEILIEKITAILSDKTVGILESLLNERYEPYPKLFVKLQATPPVPSRRNFSNLIKMENTGREIAEACVGIRRVLSEKLIEEYADSVRRVWSVTDLKRFLSGKRATFMASAVLIFYGELLDHIIIMFDRLVLAMDKGIEKKWQESVAKRFSQNRSNREIIIQAAEAFAQPVKELLTSHSNFDITALRKALQDRSARGDQDEIDRVCIIGTRVRYYRSILRLFIATNPKISCGHEELAVALSVARDLTGSVVPANTTHFIERKYLPIARVDDGLRRDIWEYFLILQLAIRIRAQDVFFQFSRKSRGFWNRISEQNSLPAKVNPVTDLEVLRNDFHSEINLFNNTLSENTFVKIVDRKIRLGKDSGMIDPVSRALHDKIEQSLPRIRIEELVALMDKVTNFSAAFRHHATQEPLEPSRRHVLYALLIAQATNIGIAGMASAVEGISVSMLDDIARGYQSAECIRNAMRIVNNYQASLEDGNIWGNGSLSSSDGQMFRVHGKSLFVEFHPRKFGFAARGINAYTHNSDRNVILSAQILACSKREWYAVLDGLLGNDSVISPSIHTTDTHGYTDHLFALCWLLGIVFAPRIKDAGSMRLWLPVGFDAGNIGDIFEDKRISLDNIAMHWEPIQKIVSALKQRLIDGQNVCMRLANASGDPVANVLLDLGRLVKTAFLFKWYRDSAFRRMLHAQLNKGEARHTLARSVNFASGTGFRSSDPISLMHRTSVLALMCNLIVTWNTTEIGKLIASLRQHGTIQEGLNVSSVSPLACAHIIKTGTYHFNQEVRS